MKRVRSLTALVFLVTGICWGQNLTKTGTTAAKFLSIPVGARALGMGGAFVALADDATGMYWNPAGIARAKQREVVLAHTEWIADIDFNYAGVILPLRDLGTVGVSFTSLNAGEMERTTEDQPDGIGEYFSAGSFAIGISFARNLTNWFSIGGNVKYISETIWNSGATGFAVDLGTLFTTPFPGLTFGAGISNFGGKMQIIGEDLLVQKDISPNKGNNPNINANLTTERFDLPLNLRIGIAYEAFADDWHTLVVAADASHPNDNAESINTGVEYSFFSRMIFIRAGYKGFGLREHEEEFTLGTGIQYNVSEELGFKFDYAYESFGRLKNIHKLALGVVF
ncbi:MAG TPA: PorV/PorQ family protein [Bacteroidota bacterium]|nr:PorV/PorQ family protein [Bacteroidota bacterium]